MFNSNEEKIKKLNKTIYYLNSANSKLSEFNTYVQYLKNVFNNSIKINDVFVYKEYPDNASNDVASASSNISQKIIPSIKKTIEKLNQG